MNMKLFRFNFIYIHALPCRLDLLFCPLLVGKTHSKSVSCFDHVLRTGLYIRWEYLASLVSASHPLLHLDEEHSREEAEESGQHHHHLPSKAGAQIQAALHG